MEYYWHGNKLKDELLNVTDINKIRIATAFMSQAGLDALRTIIDKNRLTKNNVILLLAPDFSTQKPHHFLKELTQIAVVYIVYGLKFHPKVYIFEGKKTTKLIYGSSNFTNGGMEENIEFDSIKEIGNEELKDINNFFDFCIGNAKLVNDEIIKYYEKIASELEKLNSLSQKIKAQINIYECKDDPFSPDKYDLSTYFFKFEDYEIFFNRNQYRTDSTIAKKRKAVQEKLIAIHELIYPKVKKLNLNCHWDPNHVTSLIWPSPYNRNRVNWMGVRYGKTKYEIKQLNKGIIEKDEEYGFQKHACLQFCIYSKGFDISLYHAVAHGAVDRAHVHEKLDDQSFRKKLVEEIRKIQGYGIVWYLDDYIVDVSEEFVFDEEEPENFIKFYKENDREGKSSYLSFHFEPNSNLIKNKDTIGKLVLEKFDILLPLYNLMSFRISQ